MILKFKQEFLIIIISLFLFITLGYVIGSFIGTIGLKDLVLHNKKLYLLLFKPSERFYEVYNKINSNNELKRLSGYYALLDNHMIDPIFLKRRYKIEKSLLLKRTILWLLSFATNKDEVISFYRKIYKNSSNAQKVDILQFYKRIAEISEKELKKLKIKN